MWQLAVYHNAQCRTANVAKIRVLAGVSALDLFSEQQIAGRRQSQNKLNIEFESNEISFGDIIRLIGSIV